jgi:hypothetical protein
MSNDNTRGILVALAANPGLDRLGGGAAIERGCGGNRGGDGIMPFSVV